VINNLSETIEKIEELVKKEEIENKIKIYKEIISSYKNDYLDFKKYVYSYLETYKPELLKAISVALAVDEFEVIVIHNFLYYLSKKDMNLAITRIIRDTLSLFLFKISQE
jgi:hypothetical protein